MMKNRDHADYITVKRQSGCGLAVADERRDESVTRPAPRAAARRREATFTSRNRTPPLPFVAPERRHGRRTPGRLPDENRDEAAENITATRQSRCSLGGRWRAAR